MRTREDLRHLGDLADLARHGIGFSDADISHTRRGSETAVESPWQGWQGPLWASNLPIHEYEKEKLELTAPIRMKSLRKEENTGVDDVRVKAGSFR